MAEERKWRYSKLDEDGKIKIVDTYTNDTKGSITGQIVFNVKAWFDENPNERIRLGWVKCYYIDRNSIEYNKQTQFLSISTRQIDEHTVEEVAHVLEKSEEMLALEEIIDSIDGFDGTAIIL